METIRSRMKKRGITMKMVAVASGTNVSTVSQILNDNLNDRVKTAADRLIGVVDQEIVGSLNPEAYLQQLTWKVGLYWTWMSYNH